MGATALEPHGTPGPFAAWGHRDYRLLIAGQGIATLGGRLQAVALAYQVYGLHQSPLELGALGLVRLIPTLIFSLGGGVLADRVDRRRLLLLTEPALLCCALALALATYLGWRPCGSSMPSRRCPRRSGPSASRRATRSCPRSSRVSTSQTPSRGRLLSAR